MQIGGTFGPPVASYEWGSEFLTPKGKGPILEERLKSLMQDLGNAINESLSDSDRIAEAIGEIKGAGYDVFLVLEATIGFNRRTKTEPSAVVENAEVLEETDDAKLKVTSQDLKFLRSLKISVEDLDKP